MTTTKTGARSRAPVTRPETNGTFKTVAFKGLKLKLPKHTKLRFLKQLQSGEDQEVLDALTALLGEEQMERVWDLDVDISGGMGVLVEVVADLVKTVLGAYNIDLGE